jgi:hypothetical protein
MGKGKAYRGYRDLKVYQLAYQLALEIHQLARPSPQRMYRMLYGMIDKADKFCT